MNRCSKLSCYVNEIPNAFIWRISHKLASIVKLKTRRALGIAVLGFLDDHLKDKKVTELFVSVQPITRRSRLDDQDDPHHCMTCIARLS